ncbi:CopG family transcriptional regulator [Streptomyces californicus]|uniref:CopG family transcriptional regulator n=1 Tax=Streptomyces californicus TaxID=67351 RepID=UPI003787D19B
MAMNLRLRDDQTAALRRRAEQDGTSMHSVVLRAVDDYLVRTAQQVIVRRTAQEQAAKWSEQLERLK